MFKYPRTQHIQGSRLQHGDHDLEAVPWSELRGKHLVVEEKMDGANAGISFVDGKMMLQSRGHYLRGGPREKHFTLFKQWAATREVELAFILCEGPELKERYVMFGEWMFAKHTCFYDALPHYFMEFDIFDTETQTFLSTARRHAHYAQDKIIEPVLVLAEGKFDKLEDLTSLIGPSRFKTPEWVESMLLSAKNANVASTDILKQVDGSILMEGLYVKWEEDGIVKGRYKYVRPSFTNSIMDQDQHWLNRPIVANMLAPGAQDRMFARNY